MRSVINIGEHKPWARMDLCYLQEMFARGDLIVEISDTLNRPIPEIERKIAELRLGQPHRPALQNRAA